MHAQVTTVEASPARLDDAILCRIYRGSFVPHPWWHLSPPGGAVVGVENSTRSPSLRYRSLARALKPLEDRSFLLLHALFTQPRRR
jgi:hypothetical protein